MHTDFRVGVGGRPVPAVPRTELSADIALQERPDDARGLRRGGRQRLRGEGRLLQYCVVV